jgi:hypothetical protein
MEQNKHLEKLGLKAKDVVTGYSGVITTISFDLYGCVQCIITPPIDEDGEIKHGNWFDITRVKILDNNPVMQQPDFDKGYVAEGKKGCSIKPPMQ